MESNTQSIVIIDYGMGNSGSIRNMLSKIGKPSLISSDPHEIGRAEKLILPGVGAFDHGMKNLAGLGIIPVLEKRVLEDKIPLLGICLGMQLLTRKSEEGALPGLGWFEAETVRFNFGSGKVERVPHMGWNLIKPVRDNPLVEGLPEKSRFYFVHSYHLVCDGRENVLTITDYGYEFSSAIYKENIYGVQFHPEKSHKFGMKLLKNYLEL